MNYILKTNKYDKISQSYNKMGTATCEVPVCNIWKILSGSRDIKCGFHFIFTHKDRMVRGAAVRHHMGPAPPFQSRMCEVNKEEEEDSQRPIRLV